MLVTSIFSFSHNVFTKDFFLRVVKTPECVVNLTLSKTTNFRLSKLKAFADDNFKFAENGIEL